MNFKKVRNVRLYETIIQQIRQMIDEGKLKPGDKFPSERELMVQLGVSRSILREAFRVLESRGLVESKPGGGRFLRNVSGFQLINCSAEDLERDALLEVVEAREIIEVKIVRLAAKRATEEEIEKLIELDKEFHGNDMSIKEYMEKDRDLFFHIAIAESAHNFILKEVISHILNISRELRERAILDYNDWVNLCKQHGDIVKAIAKRDEEEAAKKMAYHLSELRRDLLKRCFNS
ncbi:MAG: FadR/GntR family transcriptional regulator [Thermovenabulum sp.]|uniref:FadR/GntR family transcriptional regulator n=1 Tax=Thermovenabulum sp. TaxID=3100335 RepID=UPI003C7CEB6F